ncbi:hypothetical protein P8452_56403 [Trifolium repens]|nr:hypothetical protein P8452_56403 [Trifolium repens]
MSTASKTTPSTKTNTPPPSPKPNSPHHEEIQSEEESPVDREETIAAEEQPVIPDSPEQEIAAEEQPVIPDSPEQEIVEEDQPAEVEEPEDDTQSDKGKEAKSSVDVEDSNPSDKDVDGDTTIVDVEDYDSDLPLNMIAEDSIARRTRSGKGPATVERSPAATKEKKKPVKRQVLFGPKKGYSKVVVPPAKKKTQKRKEPPTSDSEYDVEQDVAHIGESEDESAEEHNVELDVVHIESAVKKSYGKKKIPQGIPDIPVDLISFHNPAHAGKWKYIAHRRLALERELSAEALQCKEVMKLIKRAGLMKTVSGLSDCYEKVVKEFLVNIPAGCDNPLDKEYQTVFVRGKEIHFSPTIINKFLGRSEEPYAEMEANDNYIIKAITAGKVKSWPKKGKLQASKLTPIYNILNRIAAANWVPTTHNCDVATGLARFIYTDDLSCRRETAISFSPKQSDVTPNVGTSSSTNAMFRTDMIAALKETCKALDEKKAKLEAVIAGLELEDEQTMAEDEELEEEDSNDSEAEETDGSQDI